MDVREKLATQTLIARLYRLPKSAIGFLLSKIDSSSTTELSLSAIAFITFLYVSRSFIDSRLNRSSSSSSNVSNNNNASSSSSSSSAASSSSPSSAGPSAPNVEAEGASGSSLPNAKAGQLHGQNRTVGAKKKASQPAVNTVFVERLVKLLKVCIPSVYSREMLQMLSLTVFLLSRTYLTIAIAEVMGGIAKSLVECNFRKFISSVTKLGLIAIPASMVNSGLKFFTSMLALNFRERLTHLAHEKYLSNMTFYRASNLDTKIDNCDQRISQDIDKFCECVSDLYSSTFKPLVDVVLFTRKLSATVGMKGPFLMFFYYFISGMLLRSITPAFAKLISFQQKYEGDFRFSHNRLITHAEEIAFYGGSKREKAIVNQRFDTIFKHARTILRLQGLVNIFDGWLVKYGATMAGYAVVALPVFGTLSSVGSQGLSASERTRDYTRNTQILINLAKAIGQLVLLYKRLMSLAGYTARVSELYELLDTLNKDTDEDRIRTFVDMAAIAKLLPEPPIPPTYLKGETIRFERVCLVAPDGDVLVKELSFEVHFRQNLLIAGPNGSGKSSLFRVLSELWPLQCGCITKPGEHDIFYIPQRPYLAMGTLRDQVIYPHCEEDMRRLNQTDADLQRLLESVDLVYLTRRAGGWNAVEDWADTLSGGEKQRVAMARLFYHRPRYAILDECTSAVSIDVEGKMYQSCRDLGITLITVSHRKSLWPYHEFLLHFDGEGNWTHRPLTEDERKIVV